MTRETLVPSIPDIRADNAADVLRAIKSTLDVREGRIGDPLDQLVTMRDLSDLSLVTLGGRSTLTNGSTVPVVVPGTGGDGYNPSTDYTTPPVPTDLVASGGFANVYLSWTGASYRNHSYTEIWRSNTNELGTAVLVGTSSSNVYADAATEGSTYYYWIRFVSVAAVIGPYNGTEGTSATTATDPGVLLDVLTGQITESQLYASLGARINLIDGPSTLANSVAARIAAEAAARTSAIQGEATTRAQSILDEAAARSSADSSLQTQINMLSAAGSGDFTSLLAAVQEEQAARIAGDSAQATARETLAAQLRGSYTGTDPSALTTGIVYNERQARISAESAISSSVSALSATVSNNYSTLNSAITSEQTARASADSAITTSINSLTATVNTKNRSYSQGTAPAATGLVAGDIWFDTSNDNKAYRWSGSAWTPTDDTRIAANAAAITTEQTARANADSALATSISQLSSTVTTNYNTLNSAITSEASTRSSADTALTNSINTLSSTVTGNYNTLNAAISTEQSTRASADSAMAASINSLQATASGFDTGISWNFDSTAEGFTASYQASLAWSNGGIVLTSTGTDPVLNGPSLSLDGSKNYLVRMRVKRLAGSAWDGKIYYDTPSHGQTELYRKTIPDTTVLNEWRVLEWDMSDLTVGGNDWITSTIAGIRFDLGASAQDQFLIDWISIGRIAPKSYSALITAEATARASGDEALSSLITNLQSVVNNNAISLQTEQSTRATADGQLFAQYTVKIDSNGYVTGFGLASTTVNGTPTSSFLVRADSFSIANPSGPSISPSMPFIVRTTGTTINGEYVGPGVYMADAFIQNGTITSAKIGSLTADKITTGTLTAAISVNTGQVYGGVNPNTGWAPGSVYFGTGFFLGNWGGNQQFYVGSPSKYMLWNGSDLTVRGTVYADAGSFAGTIYAGSGTIGGNTIVAAGISSPGYSPGSSGWSLNSSGVVEFQNATVRGVIRSTDGKFIIDTLNKYIRIEV
jgi:hypothetical protein